MNLLERDTPLRQLGEVFDRVRVGLGGGCVLVHGEAGIGKTALVQAFLRVRGAAACEPLITGCEALHTPRPLGPLVDLADRFPPSLSRALHQGSTWNGLFPALLGHFRQTQTPTLLVIEDLHWADDATLDFVRYAGRRLHDVPLLLLLTYRSDELGSVHPLRRVLGELPAASTTRIALTPLSVDAVAALAGAGTRSARKVFDATGGNPFYVTEVLATAGDGVPPSVHDAVLARLAGLSAAARDAAERTSLFPNQVDVALLTAIEPIAPGVIDECLQRGLLVLRGAAALGFRHELARDAVYQAIRPHRRASLHAAVFAALQAQDGGDASLPSLVHHAESASLDEAVARLAPRAARHAAGSGAHREAARLYALALRHGTASQADQRAAVLEARAVECTLTGQHGEAIRARREALVLRRDLGEQRAEGINLRWLARLHSWIDSVESAYDYARQAIDVLEALLPDAELAIAYSTMAYLLLIDNRPSEVEAWGHKAIVLAEQLDDTRALCEALTTVATARLRLRDEHSAWLMLERSLALAHEARLEAEAARAFNNLQIMSVLHRRFGAALGHSQRGIDFCEARGLDVFNVRMRIRRAFTYLQSGQWALADADLAEVREHHRPSVAEQATRDFVQGLLDLRRGAGAAPQRLAKAVAALRQGCARIWFTSTEAAEAEAAWLVGDSAALQAAVVPALGEALANGDAWLAGELAAWLTRGGVALTDPHIALHIELHTEPNASPYAGPYALEAEGNASAAARAWAALGCPYEEAMALGSSNAEADLRAALQRFEQLGAAPAAEAMRRRLRALGARGVQRGPQPRTRVDPLGLTAREREVFEQLLQGLSNAAIAQHMHRSERTVEHHVAGVFAKLGVSSRAELIAAFGAMRPPQN